MQYRVKTFNIVLDAPGVWNTNFVRSSEDCWRFTDAIYKDLDADKEHFVILSMNNKNRVNGFKLISTGSMTASLVHPREVYTALLYLHSVGVIFVHNHPSGDPAPSPEDIDITKRLKEVGDVLGIRVLDHVIRGQERFFSFNDRGLL
jgi:DNA repair protein RadC